MSKADLSGANLSEADLSYTYSGIIARNGLDQQITVINKLSNFLKVGKDLPEKADIIVAEVFDTGLLGEQALRTFTHARAHLLKPGGIILPPAASVHAVLIESEHLHREVIVGQCNGFDVRPLNEFTPPYFQARLDAFPNRVLSETITAGRYDFLSDEDTRGTQVLEVKASTTGTCHGVCFWFSLEFAPGIAMSTGPENRWNCWMQAISPFRTPVPVHEGESLRLRFRQASNRILSFDLASP